MDTQNYNFEEFTPFKGKFTSKISLNKTGGFAFSSGFWRKNSLDGVIGTKMFFDKEKKAVAFVFLKTEENGMVKIKSRGEQGGGYVNAKSFFAKYLMHGIDYKKMSGKYDPTEIENSQYGKMYIIELKEHAS